MRVLQVAQKFSLRPTSGAELRIFHLAKRLARHMQVTHLGFSRGGDEAVTSDGIEFVPVPREGVYRTRDLIRGAVGNVPFSALNYTRESMRRAMAERLSREHFDAVLLESVHLGSYVPLLRSTPGRPEIVLCDWHNIESEVLERNSDGQGRPLRKLYARHTARLLAAFERTLAGRCDLNLAVSERDREAILNYGATPEQVALIDNGVDAAWLAELPEGRGRRNRILYVGSMDTYENADAVTFFASNAWPRIRREAPECVFTIVGRNPSRDVRALAGRDGIEVTGSVEDVRPYYGEGLVAVAPLRVAGGTRIKILEAMAAGIPVVATARGAEGLEAIPGTHYLMAEDGESLAAAVLEFIRDGSRREQMVEAARKLVRERYDWPVMGDRLAEAIMTRLESRRLAAAGS